MNPVLENLYNYLKSKDVELPETVEAFGEQLGNDAQVAKNTYDFVLAEGEVSDLPDTLDKFVKGLGVQKKSPRASGSGYAGGSPEQIARLKSTLGIVTSPFGETAPELGELGPITPEDEAAAKDFATRDPRDNKVPYISSLAGKYDKGVIKTFTAVPKAVAKGMSMVLGQPLEDQILYKAADWVDKQVDEYIATNPIYDDDTASSVMETAGVLTAFMLGGSMGRTSRTADLAIPTATKATMNQVVPHLPAAFMAASGTAMAEYETAIAKGATQKEADETFLRSLSSGLPFLVSPTIRAFNKATNGKFRYGMIEGVKGGITGAFQLATSQALANVSAKEAYDETRGIIDGVMDAGGSGFAINGFLTGLIAAVSHSPLKMDTKLSIIDYAKKQQKLLSDNNIRDNDFFKRGTDPIEMELKDGVWTVKDKSRPAEAPKSVKALIGKEATQEGNVAPGKEVSVVPKEKTGLQPVFEEGDATAKAVIDPGQWPHYERGKIKLEEESPGGENLHPEQIDLVEAAERKAADKAWSERGFQVVPKGSAEIERISSEKHAEETGVTLNPDGSVYTGKDLIVPIASENITQRELTQERVGQFIEKNKGKIDTGVVKVGVYKFPGGDRVSLDLNVVVPHSKMDQAIALARSSGQKSILDMQTGKSIDTGETGENPKSFTDEEFKSAVEALIVTGNNPSVRFKAGSGDLIKDSYYESSMTRSASGNYEFFHVTQAPEKSIMKGIDSRKYHSTRTSRQEKGLQYGVASFYTKPTDSERMVGGDKYAVSVSPDKVYPMDSDPLGFRKKAEKKFDQDTPFREQAIKRDMADQAKAAGFEMAVGEWFFDRSGRGMEKGPALRADALVPLKPRKFNVDEKFLPPPGAVPHPDQGKILSKERLDMALSSAIDHFNKKQSYGEGYKMAKDIISYGGIYENGAVREFTDGDIAKIKESVPARIAKRIDESLFNPNTVMEPVMREIIDRIETGITRFGGRGVELLSTDSELAELAETLAGRKQFFAEGLLTGDVKIPEKIKSGSLVDKAEWLYEWSRKKNKVFKKGIENMSDEQIVTGLASILRRELDAWQAIHGESYRGFYDFDIGTILKSDLHKFAVQRYGRELTRGEEVAYHVLSAFASPSANPKFDSQKGLEIFDRMMLGDGIPSPYTNQPKLDEKGKQVVKGGVPQMTQVAPYYATDSLLKYNELLTKRFNGDKEKLAEWLTTKHPYAELSEIAGKPATGPKSKRLATHEYLTEQDGGHGIFLVTGPKLGSYILNRLGDMSTVTKDLWWTRWFNRATGQAMTADGQVIGLPPAASTKEGLRIRRLADEAFGIVAREMDTTPADIQQKIWDFEQKIYQMMGHSNDPKYASEGLAAGAKKILPDFKSVHYLSDKTGKIYGFTHEGKIYLSRESMDPNVAIHEAGEIWTEWASKERPDLYQAGLEKVVDSPYLEEVKNSSFYQEQTKNMNEAQREDYMRREALNRAIGDEGARFVDEAKKSSFKQWLADLWNSIAQMAGIRGISPEEISKMSLKEFARRVIADVFTPSKDLPKPEDQTVEYKPGAFDVARAFDGISKSEAPLGGITPATINPLYPLQGALKLINRAQDLTVGKASMAVEDWMAKMENKALKSSSYSIRAAAQAMRNIIGGLPYTQSDLSSKLKFAGGKNTAAVQAKIAFDEWYKIIDKDPESLARVHAAMDPEVYKDHPTLSRITPGDLNPREQALMEQLRKSNDFIHDWVYSHNLISEQTYNRYKGKYIARMYEEFEMLPDDLKQQMKSGGADLTFLYRRDADPQAEILKDPVYATAKRMGQVLQVKAIFEYAEAIKNSKTVQVSDTEFPGSVQLGSPDARPYYGVLTGKYVPQYIAEDFRGFFFSNHVLQNFYDFAKTMDRMALKQFLKKSKTVYAPVVQLGNFASNFSMAFWSGIDPITFSVNQVRAISEIRKKGPMYMEALNNGVISSDILISDLQSVAPRSTAPGMLGSSVGRMVDAEARLAEWISNKMKTTPGLSHIRDLYNRVTGGATRLYTGVDDVAKLAGYISNREAGYSVEDAARRTYEGFQNYLTVGKMYDAASKTPVIGNPYIKFKADLARMMKNAITRRPLNTALYLAMLYMIKEWLSADSGEDPAVKAIREGRSFVPKVMTPFGDIPLVWQTPFGEINVARFMAPYYAYDKGGDDTYINSLSEWMPYQVEWGPGTNKDTYSTYIEMPDVLWGTIAQVIFDTDFRGKSIKDPRGNKYHSVAVSGWDQTINSIHFLMRSQVPFFRSADDLIAAMEGRPDYYNRIRDVRQAMLNNVIKIQEFGPEEAQAYIVREIDSRVDKLVSIEADLAFLAENYGKELMRIEQMKASDEAKSRERRLALEGYMRNSGVKSGELLRVMIELTEKNKLFSDLANSTGNR